MPGWDLLWLWLLCKYWLPHSCWVAPRATKGTNDKLCSSKCHTWSRFTLFFFPFLFFFLLLACIQVHTFRLHDLGGTSRGRKKKKKERIAGNSGYCETREKGGRGTQKIRRVKKKSGAKASVWCGLGGLVLMTLHSGNSRYCHNLLFKNQSEIVIMWRAPTKILSGRNVLMSSDLIALLI